MPHKKSSTTKSKQNKSVILFDELYRTLSDQAGEAIYVLDLKGVFIYANPAVKNVAGFSPTDYIGKHFEDFIDQNSLSRAWEFFKKVQKTKTVLRDELDVIKKTGGVVPVEFTISPILRNGKIVQIHAIVRNVSEKKLIENNLRGSEKLKTVQHFISGTVKEIQFPLKAVYDHLDLLLAKYKDKNFEYIGYKEFNSIISSLSVMRDEVRECFQTAQKLLLLSKKKIGIKDQRCQSNLIIKEICSLYEHELDSHGIKLKLNLAQNLPNARIGNLEFNQIIVNILSNAIHSIVQNGSITIKSYYDASQNRILIECKDTGMGISKEALKHIFEPFFTTKKNEGGKNLGLGLSICYFILQSIKGDIQIKSSLKHGTQVIIFLPAESSKS